MLRTAPPPIEPFEAHDPVPATVCSVLSRALAMDVMPPPGAALPLPELGAGEAVEKPVVKSHRATVTPQRPVPGGGALFTVSVAEALSPVLTASMNRLLVVFISEPVAVGVTFTLIWHVPLAATVPPEKEMVLAPAFAVSVGAPQPVVVAFGGVATTRLAGRLSTKL